MLQRRWVACVALALLVSACGQPDQPASGVPTLVAQPSAAAPAEPPTPQPEAGVAPAGALAATSTLPTNLPGAPMPTPMPIVPPLVPIPPNAVQIQPCSAGSGCAGQCLSGPGCISTTPVPPPAGADASVLWIAATDKINLMYPADHTLSDADIEAFYTAHLQSQHWQRAPARMCRRVDEFDLEVREIVTYNLTTSQGNTTLRWCLIIAEWIPYLPVTATFPAYPVTRPQWQHLQIFWGYQLDATITPFPPTFPPGTVMRRAYPGPGTDTGNEAPRYYPAPGAPSAVPQGSTVRPAGAPAAYPIVTPAEPTASAPAP